MLPHLVTDLPGPRAQEILDLDSKYVSPSYTRSYPLVAERGEGCIVEDPDGNRFLDFNAGIAVCSTGHCHPEVVEAIRAQAGKLIHMSGTDFYYGSQVQLAKKMADLAPIQGDKRVFFANSGAEAVECALKLARYKTGRRRNIAFLGAFHGRTMGALSLTASKALQRSTFAPLTPEVFHVPYANCYRCDVGKSPDSCAIDCLNYIENVVLKRLATPEDIAAIFVEPIQGEGGYVVPPKEFLQGLRELTQKHGILLVVDEVQSGMGRTGKMFAIEHFDIEPDIICVAKGVASGMPLGVTIARSEIMDWEPGMHASTFGGNPVSCEAALKTIELIEGGLLENAREMGDYLQSRLRELMERYDHCGDVRGKGLMVGMEMVHARVDRLPAPRLRDSIVDHCFRQGVLLLGCGPNTIRFSPPLIVTREQIDCAVAAVERALVEVTGPDTPEDGLDWGP